MKGWADPLSPPPFLPRRVHLSAPRVRRGGQRGDDLVGWHAYVSPRAGAWRPRREVQNGLALDLSPGICERRERYVELIDLALRIVATYVDRTPNILEKEVGLLSGSVEDRRLREEPALYPDRTARHGTDDVPLSVAVLRPVLEIVGGPGVAPLQASEVEAEA
jgi:hypothetical protein